MNNRQLTVVLVALGLVAVGVIWKFNSGAPVTAGRDAEKMERALPNFALNDVVGIQLKTKKDEVNLARTGDTWGVKERDGYPANYDHVKDLVTKAFDLRVVESLSLGQSQLGRLHLIDPTSDAAKDAKDDEVGTLVVFKKENDQEVGRVLLGKMPEAEANPDNPFFNMGGSNGRFIQVGGKSDVAFKVKESFTSLNVEVKDWLDKQFIAPSGGLKSIEVKVADPADQSWKVDKEKEGADPVLADKKEGEDVDAEKVKQAGSAFSSAYFSDVATVADKDKTGLDSPKRTATVTFFDGFTYTIKVGNKIKPDDENSEFYLGLSVAYTPVPEPSAPAAEAAPPEPPATPAPDGETDDQKKEREKKDADAKAAWEQAKQAIASAKTKYEADKKQWEEDKKKKEERLAKEKAFEGKTYLVTKYTVDWFMKDRGYFMKAAAAPAAAVTTPPGTAVTPPVSVPGTLDPTSKPKRIEAVTPPIAVELPRPKDAPPKPEVKPAEKPKSPKPELPPLPPVAKPAPAKDDAKPAPAPAAPKDDAKPAPAPAEPAPAPEPKKEGTAPAATPPTAPVEPAPAPAPAEPDTK